MNLEIILDQLRHELDAIEAAILRLEYLEGRSNRGPLGLSEWSAKSPTSGANGGYRNQAPGEE
jgi:hypothetical protein